MRKKFLSLAVVVAVSLSACHKPPKAPPAAPSPTPASRPVATPSVSAPGDNRPERRAGASPEEIAQRAKERLDQMKADLSLTDAQADKIRTIMDQRMVSMQAMRDDQSMSREDRRAKMAESRQAVDAQIEAILTPEQKPKWEEQKKKREAEMAGRRANRQQGAGGDGRRGQQ